MDATSQFKLTAYNVNNYVWIVLAIVFVRAFTVVCIIP